MCISGTQVAMNACSIVLLDDNFASIVQACRWGRNVLEAIRKFLQFQLSVNFSAVIITFLGSIIEGESPLTAVQLLWVNLIMDSLGSLALASEEPDDFIMLKPPQTRKDKILTPNMAIYVTTVTVFQVALHMFVNFDGYRYVGIVWDDTIRRHTLVFTTFVLMQVVNEVLVRQLEMEYNFLRGILRNNYFLSILLLICVVQVIAVQFGGSFFQTIGLNGTQWAACIILALTQIPYVLLTRLIYHWHVAYKKKKSNTVTSFKETQQEDTNDVLPMKEVAVDKERLMEKPAPGTADSVYTPNRMVNNLFN